MCINSNNLFFLRFTIYSLTCFVFLFLLCFTGAFSLSFFLSSHIIFHLHKKVLKRVFTHFKSSVILITSIAVLA